MQKPRSLLSILLLASIPGACAVEPPRPAARSLDVSAAVGDGALLGLAREGSDLHLLVGAPGGGGASIVRVDEQGVERARYAPGDRGLLDLPYRDVGALGDERFVLIADGEGYLYDALTEQQRVHFCVEPAIEPGEPGEPGAPPPAAPLVQKNDAVAVRDDVIVAAPRFYDEGGALVEASLRVYRSFDGAPLGEADLTALALEIDDLALSGQEVWGVAGAALHRFTLGGEHLGTLDLEGSTRAVGLAIDDEAGHVWVADGDAPVVRAYAVDDL